MISKIEIWIESEDDAQKLASNVRELDGHHVRGPFYTDGYGAPVQFPLFREEKDKYWIVVGQILYNSYPTYESAKKAQTKIEQRNQGYKTQIVKVCYDENQYGAPEYPALTETEVLGDE